VSEERIDPEFHRKYLESLRFAYPYLEQWYNDVVAGSQRQGDPERNLPPGVDREFYTKYLQSLRFEYPHMERWYADCVTGLYGPAPARYARAKGHWITIGGHEDPKTGRKHVGGTPVYVENGRITKGHPSLMGKRIDALAEPAEGFTHRQELHQGKEYNRAVWGKKARHEGIASQELHQLAAEILAHDKEFKADRTKVLQRARDMSRGLGYGDIGNLKARAARGDIDADSIRGLDDVAARLREEYPEVLGFDETEAQNRLFDLLTQGNPELMAEENAYAQAFEHLLEAKRQEAAEVVPFQRRGELERYRPPVA
jgi:hypothetical protein